MKGEGLLCICQTVAKSDLLLNLLYRSSSSWRLWFRGDIGLTAVLCKGVLRMYASAV